MNFFHRESKSKKKIFFGGGGAGGLGEVRGGGGRNRWKDRRTGPIQFPIQLLRSWGHNNALMYKLCP